MYKKNFIVNADSSLENSITKECFKLVIFLFLKNKNTKTFLREATLVKIATIIKETKKNICRAETLRQNNRRLAEIRNP